MSLKIIDEKDMIPKRGVPLVTNGNTTLSLLKNEDVRFIPRVVRNSTEICFKNTIDGLKSFYYNNPYCSSYMSSYIDQYVRQIVGARRGKSSRYWMMNLEGKEVKVRHITSCLRTNWNEYAWYFDIGFDEKARGFILSAFKDRVSLEPMHLWFIKSNELISLGDGEERSFWNRSQILIDANSIDKLRKFELIDQLISLKNIMREVSIKENEKNGKDLRRKLLAKQNNINKITGYSFSIDFIIHQTIKAGIGLYELKDTTIDLLKELDYELNKKDMDNDLTKTLENYIVGTDIKINKLIEMAISIGLTKVEANIVIDKEKVDEFVNNQMKYHATRHIGSWKGNKNYIRNMHPVIREGLKIILKDYYLANVK